MRDRVLYAPWTHPTTPEDKLLQFKYTVARIYRRLCCVLNAVHYLRWIHTIGFSIKYSKRKRIELRNCAACESQLKMMSHSRPTLFWLKNVHTFWYRTIFLNWSTSSFFVSSSFFRFVCSPSPGWLLSFPSPYIQPSRRLYNLFYYSSAPKRRLLTTPVLSWRIMRLYVSSRQQMWNEPKKK